MNIVDEKLVFPLRLRVDTSDGGSKADFLLDPSRVLRNTRRKNEDPCIDPISHMEVVRHALFCTLIVYRSERPLADLGWDAARQLLKQTIGCH